METKSFIYLFNNSFSESNNFLPITPAKVIAIIAFNILLLVSMTSFAQTKNGTISGKTSNLKGEVMPFTNILLLNAKDSSMARGAVTDI